MQRSVYLVASALACAPRPMTTVGDEGGHAGLGAAPAFEASPPAGLGGFSGAQQGTDPSGCVDSGHDDPDDAFADSNCDGIDGDLARAVFVAADGDDSAAGTLDAPLATIEAALAHAGTGGEDIYVCNGVYEQAVLIRQPVRIFGGYDCAGGGRRVVDQARFFSSVAVPLRIEDTTGVLLERLAFTAPDVAKAEGSSIAALVQRSTDVALRRVEFTSGRAGAGTTGAPGVALLGRAPQGQAGTAACLQLLCDAPGQGGFSKASPVCEGGLLSEFGGAGGDGGHDGLPAQAGQPSPGGAPGGQVSSLLEERDGEAGASGARGKAGAGSQVSVGTFESGAYQPTNSGEVGGYGEPGQAGGGGAGVGELWQGDLCCKPGHGGSQGGFGGCGGRPGHGGTGGGASIALMVAESAITLTWTRLLSGEGGKGGTGGTGGPPQAGGLPGAVYDFQGVRLSGVGGPGGSGGRGGPGGPGGGGPSLGLGLWNSPLPAMEGVQVLVGSPGFGGDAAPDADGAADGPDGLAAPGYDFTAHEIITF